MSRWSMYALALALCIVALIATSTIGPQQPPVSHAQSATATPTPIPTCPASLSGATEPRCYAARYQYWPTPAVAGALSLLDGYMVPCVPHSSNQHFSLAAMWVNGPRWQGDGIPSNELPWLEFGVVVFGSTGICPHNRGVTQYYSFCGNCYNATVTKPPGRSRNGWDFHSEVDPNDGPHQFAFYYFENVPSLDNPGTTVDRWHWWLDGKMIRYVEDSTVRVADTVRIGSETTDWDNDAGRVLFSQIHNREVVSSIGSSIITDWIPDNTKFDLGSETGLHNGHRYWNYYKPPGETLPPGSNPQNRYGSLVWVNSDDSEYPNSTRCDFSHCPTLTPPP